MITIYRVKFISFRSDNRFTLCAGISEDNTALYLVYLSLLRIQ